MAKWSFWPLRRLVNHKSGRRANSLLRGIESLEARSMLAADSVDLFAHFNGTVQDAGHQERIQLNIVLSDFDTPTGQLLMGFSLKGAAGSPLNPAPVRLSTSAGTPITPVYLKTNVRGNPESLVIANVSYGSYQVTIDGLSNTTGPFSLDVFLAGDVNGDDKVRLDDGLAIRNLLGKNIGSPGFITSADVNRDGQITSLDYSLWARNQGSTTRVIPMSLGLELEPVGTVLSTGVLATRVADSVLAGMTSPGATVSLNVNSSGTSTTTLADSSGAFSLPLRLAAGPQTLSVRAEDHFGQHETRSVQVVLDTVGPSIVVSNPVSGLSTDQNITITGIVTDDSSGVALIQAAVDVNPFTSLGLDGTGHFSFTTNLQVDGSADGSHVIKLRAFDTLGSASSTEFSFSLFTVKPTSPNFDLSAGSTVVAPLTTSAATVTLVGSTSPGMMVSLLETGQTTLASNTGFFQFPAVPVVLGDNPFTVMARMESGASSTVQRVIHRIQANVGQQDPVLTWQQAVLDTIRLAGSAPPVAARSLAMVSAAIYDAVNAAEGRPGIYVNKAASSGASIETAVSGAASTVLAYLYPAQQSVIDGLLVLTLAQVPDSLSKTDGYALGQQIGNAVIELRRHDGWDKYVEFGAGSESGEWQPTAPMYDEALLPQWATLAPFVMTSSDQFSPPGPPSLSSEEWADAYNEVKKFGSVDSSVRTADQTQIARFWADGLGTVTPAGHWNQIALQIATQRGNSISDNARLFAQLNLALGDAAIVAWNAKYTKDFWRPITAIRAGDTDDNTQTVADPRWNPLLITPNFPEYVSGHSTFSGAAAAILTANFGEQVSFDSTSPGLPNVTRRFSSFAQAAEEAGQSRIYGGIHYQFSNRDGLAAGNSLAQYVLSRFAIATDTHPPVVLIDNPSGRTTNASITITGTALDSLSGVASLTGVLDHGAPQPITFDALGRFSLPWNLPLDGSADGEHSLVITAVDAVGNSSSASSFNFILDTKAPHVDLQMPLTGDNLSINPALIGSVSGTGSPLVSLRYAFDGGASKPLDASQNDLSTLLDISKLEVGPHTLTITAQDAAGNVTSATVNINLTQRAPLTMTSLTPTDGAVDVGATFRPKIVFSRPVDPASLTADNFYATNAAGAKIPTTIVPAADGTYAWLFFAAPLPSSTRITLHVDGATIRAQLGGDLLDADGDGAPGGMLEQLFTTVNLAPIAGTSLVGRVFDPGTDRLPMTFDDIRAGADAVLHTADDVFLNPLAGVKIFILGLESNVVYTAADGSFHFDAVPAGDIKLVIDGRTATNAPAGIFFPEMVMDLEAELGRVNTVMGTMGTLKQRQANRDRQEVYLPRLQTSMLQPVSDVAPTTLGVDAASAPNMTPEQRAQFQMVVQPGSIVGPDGQPLTNPTIGISTVPASLVRDMLPPGVLQHTLDITIQAPGAATITTPIRLTFPNTFGAAPGTQLNFLSFDHTTGRLEIEGTATVSADGLSVTTDPDTGVTHPGWHGLTPVGTPTDPPDDPNQKHDVDVLPDVVTQGIRDHLFTRDGEEIEFGIGNKAPLIHPAIPSWLEANRRATPLEVTITKIPNKTANYSFFTGIEQQKYFVYPGEGRTWKLTSKPLLDPARLHATAADALFAQKIEIKWHQLGKPDQAAGSKFMYLYRLQDVGDDVHTDGMIQFPRSQDRTLGLDMRGLGGEELNGTLAIAADPNSHFTAAPRDDSANFAFKPDAVTISDGSTNRQIAGVRFHPPIDSGDNYALLNITTPNGTVLSIKLGGEATYRQKVSLDKGGLKAAIARMLDDPMPPGIFNRFQEIFPDSDGDGKRTTGADQSLFNEAFESLYSSLVASLKTIYSSVAPPVPTFGNATQFLDFVESGTVDTDVVRWLDYIDSGMKAGTSLFVENGPETLSLRDPRSTWIDVGSSAQIVDVKLDVAPSSAGPPIAFNILGSNDLGMPSQYQEVAYVDNATPGHPLTLHFDSGLYRYYRVLSQHTGNATYKASVYGYSDVGSERGKKMVPAAYAPQDFPTGHLGSLIEDANQMSKPQLYYDFISSFNRSRTDRLTGASDASIKFFLSYTVPNRALPTTITKPSELGALFANIVGHELGHNLGVRHYSDAANEYGSGDIMGSGDSNAILNRFVYTAPTAGLALGMPVSDSFVRNIFEYYAKWELNLDDVHVLPLLDIDDSPESLFQLRTAAPFSVLTPYAFDPNTNDRPEEVFDHDFGLTSADGPSGELRSFTIYVTNEGGVPLNIKRLGLANGNQGFSLNVGGVGVRTLGGVDLSGADPHFSLLPVTVTFDPRFSGRANDVLRITSDAGGRERTVEIPLTGLGVVPAADIAVVVDNNNIGSSIVGGGEATQLSFASFVNQGASPLTVSSLRFALGAESFSLDAAAAAIDVAHPLVLAPGASFTFGVSYRASKPGIERGVIEILSTDPDDPSHTIAIVGTGLAANGSALDYGNDYVARENPLQPGANVVRQKSDDAGNWTTFLPANTPYHIAIFDPVSGLIAHMSGDSASSGQPTRLGTPIFEASTEPDSDGDGLPDDIEFAIGTAPNNTDTDGDGLSDFAAVMAGQNPLAGNLLPTGILSTLEVDGYGVQNGGAIVQVVNSAINDPSKTILYLLMNDNSLTTVDVSNPTKPVLLKKFSLPAAAGAPVDLAIDQATGMAVIVTVPAAFQKGLLFVDVSNPESPRVVDSLSHVGWHTVRIASGIAYVFGEDLRAYDLRTRELLSSTPGDPGAQVQIEAGRMYTFDGSRLRIYDIGAGRPQLVSSTAQTGIYMSVGNSVVYLTQVGGPLLPGGYATIDVSDPVSPRLISGSDVPEGQSAPYGQLTLNGSGVALVGQSSVFPLIDRVNLVDVSDAENTNSLVTTFDVPNASLSIAGGIAFATSRTSNGTTLVRALNYLPTDVAGQPPTVTLTARVNDVDSAPGVQVVEESRFAVDLRAFDDVQVRSVELLVNGRVVETSRVFPYNFEVKAPFASDGPNLTVQARATDTGGNRSLSELLSFDVIPDPTVLELVASDLDDRGARDTTFRSTTLEFSKRLDALSASSANFQLLDSQGNVIPVDVALSGKDRLVTVTFPQLVENHTYTLVIHAANVTDRAGRPLGAGDIRKSFTVFAERTNVFIARGQFPDDWLNWNDPFAWSAGHVPTEMDDVQVGTSDSPVNVILNTPPGSVATFKSLISYGKLNLHASMHVTGPVWAQDLFAFGSTSDFRDPLTQQYPLSAIVDGGLTAASLTVQRFNFDVDGPVALAGQLYYEHANGQLSSDVKVDTFSNLDARLTLAGEVEATTLFRLGASSQIQSIGIIRAGEFDLQGSFTEGGTRLRGATLVAASPTRLNTVEENEIGLNPARLENVTLQGDFEVSNLAGKSPLGFTLAGDLRIDGTLRGFSAGVVKPSRIIGTGTLIDPKLGVSGSEDGWPYQGALTIGPNITLRGAWSLTGFHGGQIDSSATLIAEEPSTIWFHDSNIVGNPETKFVNRGTIIVSDDSRLIVKGNQQIHNGNEVQAPFDLATRPSFISTTPIMVRSGAELMFVDGTARLPRINAATGAKVLFGGVLYAGVDGSTETVLSGPADWIAVGDATFPFFIHFTGVNLAFSGSWAGVFRDGTITLQDGAKLSGSGILRDVTLNGDFLVSEPPQQFSTWFTHYRPAMFYGGFLQLDRQVVLSGDVQLSDALGVSGSTLVLPTTLVGNGAIHLGSNTASRLTTVADELYALGLNSPPNPDQFGATIGPDITIDAGGGSIQVGGTLHLQGTLVAPTSGLAANLTTGTLDVQGAVIAKDGGRLQVSARQLGDKNSPRTLASGTWRAESGGTLEFAGADLVGAGGIAKNAATLVLDGVGSQFVLPGGASAFSAFENAGQVRVAHGATFNAMIFTQSAGTTVLDEGILIAGQTILQGGTLSGTGVVDGALTNRATVLLDKKAGSLHVTGDYIQAPWAQTQITLAGPTAGVDYESLVVDGSVNLRGELNVAIADGYTPALGDRPSVHSFDSLAEMRLATIPTLPLSAGPLLVPFRTANTLDLIVVTPNSALAISPAAVSLVRNEPTEVTVASLVDSSGQGAASLYSAIVDWGDGTSSVELLTADGNDRLVRASHRYTETGHYSVRVTAVKSDGSLTETSTSADVNPQTLDVTLSPLALVQSVTYASANLASFIDGSGDGLPADYGATIDWGDGTVESGQVVGGPAGMEVRGSHLYTTHGKLEFHVTVTRGGITGTALDVREVAAPSSLLGRPTSPEVPVSETVETLLATFVDPDEVGTVDKYSVTIGLVLDGVPIPYTTGSVRYNALTSNFEVWGNVRLSFYESLNYQDTYTMRTVITKANGGSATVDSLITVVIPNRIELSFNFPYLEINTSYRNFWLASFTDLRGLSSAQAYTATINWGDGVTSPGVIDTSSGDGRVFVGDDHQFTTSGFYTIQITVAKTGGPTATLTLPNFVHGPVVVQPLNVTPNPRTVYTGSTLEFFPIAHFTDPSPDQPVSGYSATIDWGDGSTTTATLIGSLFGGVDVYGQHAYAAAGGYSARVRVLKASTGATGATTAPITVVNPLPLALVVSPLVVLPTSGPEFLVASLSDSNFDPLLANGYPTSIDWGDGTTSSGRVESNGSGQYSIFGTHVYAGLGDYTLTVSTTRQVGNVGTILASASAVVQVVEHFPLQVGARFLRLDEDVAYDSLTVASFFDPEGALPTDTYTATIDWGDGSITPGQIVASFQGPASVRGSHTYAAAGNYSLTVNVTKSNGASGSGMAQATVNSVSPISLNLNSQFLQLGLPYVDLYLGNYQEPGLSKTTSYEVVIEWGEEQTSIGSIQLVEPGIASVYANGEHTYFTPGERTIRVTVRAPGREDLVATALVLISFGGVG